MLVFPCLVAFALVFGSPSETVAAPGDDEATWEELDSIADGGTVDCNGNGIDDQIDVEHGRPDSDGNGLLDECEPVPGDLDGDRVVDARDGAIVGALVGFVEGINPGYRNDADFDSNHQIDSADVERWLALAELPIAQDGIDNDHDGKADAADPDRDTPRDPTKPTRGSGR